MDEKKNVVKSIALIGFLGVSLLATSATGAVITSWDKTNVIATYMDAEGETYYDVENASIYGGVDTGGIDVSTGTAGNCITSSGTNCESVFQSGKRVKISATDSGPIDLVFNLDNLTTETDAYTVYTKLLNRTGESIDNITFELGYGIGDAFVNFGSDSALTFSLDDEKEMSKFSHGLFGLADSPGATFIKHPDDGFYSTIETGFNMEVDSNATTITSNGMYGSYSDLFGEQMLDIEDVPTGLFLDLEAALADITFVTSLQDDFLLDLSKESEDLLLETPDPSDANADWLTGYDGNLLDLLIASDYTYLGDIEDLAQTNMTFSILADDFTSGLWADTSTFTLRVSTAPVPEPTTMLLFGAGLAGLAFNGRRKKK